MNIKRFFLILALLVVGNACAREQTILPKSISEEMELFPIIISTLNTITNNDPDETERIFRKKIIKRFATIASGNVLAKWTNTINSCPLESEWLEYSFNGNSKISLLNWENTTSNTYLITRTIISGYESTIVMPITTDLVNDYRITNIPQKKLDILLKEIEDEFDINIHSTEKILYTLNNNGLITNISTEILGSRLTIADFNKKQILK